MEVQRHANKVRLPFYFSHLKKIELWPDTVRVNSGLNGTHHLSQPRKFVFYV